MRSDFFPDVRSMTEQMQVLTKASTAEVTSSESTMQQMMLMQMQMEMQHMNLMLMQMMKCESSALALLPGKQSGC